MDRQGHAVGRDGHRRRPDADGPQSGDGRSAGFCAEARCRQCRSGGQMKIVVLDGYCLNPGDLSWDELRRHGEVMIYDRTREEEVVARAAGAQVVLTNKTPLSAATLKCLPALRYIGVLATGYNIVDT